MMREFPYKHTFRKKKSIINNNNINKQKHEHKQVHII